MAILLEHKSATEERLAAGSGMAAGNAKVTYEDEDEQNDAPKVLQETTLEFSFDKTPTLKARELVSLSHNLLASFAFYLIATLN